MRSGPIRHEARLRDALSERGSTLLKVWRNPSDQGQVWVTFECVNGHIHPQRGADVYTHGCYRCAQIRGLATGPFLEPHNVYAWSFIDDDQQRKVKIGVGNRHRAITTWSMAADSTGTGHLELLIPTIKVLSFPVEQALLGLLQDEGDYTYPINPALQKPNGYTEWVKWERWEPLLAGDIHGMFRRHWEAMLLMHDLHDIPQLPGSEALFKTAAEQFLVNLPKGRP